MVWYSHLFQNFLQFIVIHTVKDFGIVNKTEIELVKMSGIVVKEGLNELLLGNMVSSQDIIRLEVRVGKKSVVEMLIMFIIEPGALWSP